MTQPLCIVVGVGPGNGAAFVQRFSNEGYRVAALARKTALTAQLAGELENVTAFECDVSQPESITGAFATIKEQLGPCQTLVYNAGAAAWGNVEEISVADFELAWQVNTRGCLIAAQRVIPDMVQAGDGNILVIGATAAMRGGAQFTAFAASKAAQRSLSQSMARHLGPKGVHVAYFVIDGVIDLPRTRERYPEKPDDFYYVCSSSKCVKSPCVGSDICPGQPGQPGQPGC